MEFVLLDKNQKIDPKLLNDLKPFIHEDYLKLVNSRHENDDFMSEILTKKKNLRKTIKRLIAFLGNSFSGSKTFKKTCHP